MYELKASNSDSEMYPQITEALSNNPEIVLVGQIDKSVFKFNLGERHFLAAPTEPNYDARTLQLLLKSIYPKKFSPYDPQFSGDMHENTLRLGRTVHNELVATRVATFEVNPREKSLVQNIKDNEARLQETARENLVRKAYIRLYPNQLLAETVFAYELAIENFLAQGKALADGDLESMEYELRTEVVERVLRSIEDAGNIQAHFNNILNSTAVYRDNRSMAEIIKQRLTMAMMRGKINGDEEARVEKRFPTRFSI
jgi:hypothetical protein